MSFSPKNEPTAKPEKSSLVLLNDGKPLFEGANWDFVTLQRVHEASNYAIEIFVRSAHLFDLIDRVKDGSVVLAAELTADLRQRCRGELLDDVHGHLTRESNRTRIAANLQVLLAQIEMFAHALLN